MEKAKSLKGSASLEISALYALGNGVSSKTTFQEAHFGKHLDLRTQKAIGPEKPRYRKTGSVDG